MDAHGQLDLFDAIKEDIVEIAVGNIDCNCTKKPQEAKTPKKKHNVSKIIETLFKRIESAQKKADGISTEISGNYTAKRAREAESRKKTKEALEAHIERLKNIKTEWEEDCLPEVLQGIRSIPDIEALLHWGIPKPLDGTEYDHYIERYNKQMKTLKRLGIETEEQSDKAKELLKNYGEVVLSAAEKRERDLKAKIDEIRGMKIDGFFPTPVPVIHRMFDYARMNQGPELRMLEPSAGIGSICDEVRELYPDMSITCCEANHRLYEILELKGYTMKSADIFHMDTSDQYDRIIMNPPFEKGQDIAHITYCFENLLWNDGILVSVASSGVMHRSSKKDVAFRELVAEHGEFVELPPEQFKGAFNSTSINVCLVVLRKE